MAPMNVLYDEEEMLAHVEETIHLNNTRLCGVWTYGSVLGKGGLPDAYDKGMHVLTPCDHDVDKEKTSTDQLDNNT